MIVGLVFISTVISMVVMTSINIICSNGRGALSKSFPRLVHDICHEKNVDIFVILEPRCSGSKATTVINKLGFDSTWRVYACGFSGGIWLLWNSCNFSISTIDEMKQNVNSSCHQERG